LLFAACATRYLVPADDAQRLYGTAIVEEHSGIQVVADPQAWTGPTEVLDELVPIWLSVTNRSERSVYVSPVDIDLVGHETRIPAELPLALDPPPLPTSTGMVPTPLRTTSSADPALVPTTAGINPSVLDSRAGVLSDQIEVRSDQSRLRDEMKRRGLRNQTLEAGETARGFVYFERASWSAKRLELRVTLRIRAGGAPVTTLKLPFSVI
jgi:hypothetical protein